MMFDGAAEHYDRFMGRYSQGLSAAFADFAGVRPGMRVLDVGSGPGALTAVLVERLGADAVAAADPSEPYIEAVRLRYPSVEAVIAGAESIPFDDSSFDAALAQLVVHFMKDPAGGLREMARVTRRGGTVAATVWDHAGGRGPLTAFWDSVHEVEAGADDESALPGARSGHLTELFEAAGLNSVDETLLTTEVAHPTFEQWWEPYTLGVGPAGRHMASLDEAGRADLRDACHRRLGDGPFTVSAGAWAARGTVS
jgi:SAM-dependent methyltransferase